MSLKEVKKNFSVAISDSFFSYKQYFYFLMIIAFWEALIMTALPFFAFPAGIYETLLDTFSLSLLSSVSIWYLILKPNKNKFEKQFKRSINIVEASFDAINQYSIMSIADPRGKIKFVNDMFCKISGYSAQELIGHDHRILNSGEHSKEFFKEMWNQIKAGQKWSGRVKNKKKNGDFYWVDCTIVPIFDDENKIKEFVSFRIDITEKVLNEQLIEQQKINSLHRERLVSLGEMSTGVAHEINNPLAIIEGNLRQLGKNRNDNVVFEQKMEIIKKAMFRINKIINGLKKFSHDDQIENKHIDESLKKIINEVISITQLKSKQYATLLTAEVEIDFMFKCNAVEIEQVLVNLINNAIDAVKNLDERWVKIKLYQDNDQAVLQIIDSGKGISEEIEKKLFNPFFTTKPVGEGTGLGLSISKGILQNHKAEIYLNRNNPNTCFEIRFLTAVIQNLKGEKAG